MLKIQLLLIAFCLHFSAFSQTDILIGSGSAGNTGTTYPCPLQDYYEGSRMQFLYLASELSSAGMAPGTISAIKFDVNNLNTFSGSIEQMKISIGTTSNASLTATTWETGLTDVFGPVNDTPVLGTNTFIFSSPFFWNGTDNIVVEICNGDPANGSAIFYTNNPTIPWTTGLSFNGSHNYRADNIGNLCGTSTATNTGLQTSRPNITFTWTVASSTGCYLPSGILVTNISATGAEASWNAPAGGVTPLQYMWELRTSGVGGSGSTGLVSSGTTAITSAIFTALSPVTPYKLYFKSDCGSGNLSSWSSGFSFTTACAPIALFSENFDAIGIPNLPLCWSKLIRVSGISTPTITTISAAANVYSSPNAISLSNSNAALNDDIILISPVISNLGAGTHRLSFYAKNSVASQDVEVGTLDDNTSTALLTPLELVDIGTTYSKYTVSFASYTGTDVYIGIRRAAAILSTFSNVYIDNVVWETIPTCQEVTAVMNSNVTSSGAQLDWTPPTGGGTLSGYHVYYSTSRVEPVDTTTAKDSSTTNTIILTGLAPATKYYIWVRTKCGAADHSPWSVVDSLVTECVPVNSFVENFDGATVPNLPVCWSKLIRVTGTAVPTITTITSTTNAYSTPNAVSLYNANASLTDEIILISPALNNVGSGTFQLSFYAKNSVATQDIEIGTLDNATLSATFSPLQTIDIGTSYQKYTVSFDGYTGSDTYIGIRRAASTLSTYSYVYIDNVVWQLIPSCAEPTNLKHSKIDSSKATLNWLAPSTTSPLRYHIYYSTLSTSPLGSTQAMDSVSGTNYDMIGLAPSTKYYVWIRSSCGGGDFSVWSSVDSFFTASPNYAWINVNGFNADVVAEGIGPASSSTTADVDNVSYVFVSGDYQYDATCPFPTQSLPISRQVYFSALGLYFNLADYASDNDLRLTTTDVGTLNFANPAAAEEVFLLGVSGSGASKMSATVNFSDGSTQFFDTLSISDWYGTTTNMVAQGVGRLLKTTTACGGLETSATNPKLYRVLLSIDPGNFSKTISGVTIARIDGLAGFGGVVNIFGVAIKKAPNVVPVKLVDFKGFSTPSGNKLEWSTFSETNNSGFEILRSPNGKEFSKIGFIYSGANNGNSTLPLLYHYIDAMAFSGTSYYRLKQIDKDGKYNLSKTIQINGTKINSFILSAVYPNPAANKLNVVLNATSNGKTIIIISDLAGRVVLQQQIQMLSGDNSATINIGKLSKGNYFVKAVCKNGYETSISKFIKQ